MTALLSWSLRFVEVFADDIIAAFTEYLELSGAAYRAKQTRLSRKGTSSRRRRPGETKQLLLAHLDEYRRRGLALPGNRTADGRVLANTYFLSAQAGITINSKSLASVFAEHGPMPIDDDTYLFTPVTATLDGRRWQNRSISYAQAPVLARHLAAACFVVIAYLSGQRPGEALNLERGCIEHDPVTGLVLLRGKHFKGVRNADGTSVTEGIERVDPWVVVEPVATAVEVVGRLHDSPLLFPNTMEVNGHSSPDRLKARTSHAARNDQLMTQDIDALIAWVNQYCAESGRTDAIPPDPVKASISLGRLRRTLAWFIVRRPRGLVAAAIQYGHLRTGMTLGYAGSYDSGFPDDLVFEEWLTRLDDLAEAHHRLRDGEHVSGPAAERYRQRVESATRFAGRVLRTSRDAAALLANPDLQIYQGNAMTCVLDPARAACRLAGDDQGTRRTPDVNDCRPTCANIARTDRDIAELLRQADQLRPIVEDPLAPPIRTMRERRELTRIEKIIDDHRSNR
jgi:integrase